MLDLDKFTIKRISEADNVGVFVIGPLPRGYGNTIANPIRRILLSSLEGGAITSIKIAGVDHEYASVSGVHEDVLKLILKLKGVAIKCFSDSPVVARIDITAKKGESIEVTAADIEGDASIEVVNKDYVITTVSDGGSLKAEITIEKGVGFKVADSDKRSEIGMIPVDGVFSPVVNVDVDLGSARVGQRTDLDQIEMTIKTNGVLSPSEALAEAFNIQYRIAARFVELVGGDMSAAEKAKPEPVSAVEEKESGILVKNLNLSTRLRNSLMNSAITDLRLLAGKSREELLEIRGMGQKSADELIQVMQENGIPVIE